MRLITRQTLANEACSWFIAEYARANGSWGKGKPAAERLRVFGILKSLGEMPDPDTVDTFFRDLLAVKWHQKYGKLSGRSRPLPNMNCFTAVPPCGECGDDDAVIELGQVFRIEEDYQNDYYDTSFEDAHPHICLSCLLKATSLAEAVDT